MAIRAIVHQISSQPAIGTILILYVNAALGNTMLIPCNGAVLS